ncbi:DUF916 domain-containing protein [Herbiconiux sp. 11R-BC]|uniref:WxL protein peptidoglycan domain-containing protein n=1 Tax=Herbiconiux sp. 11R-BC TaxID=3111637 RepID=UPI003C09225B
MNARAARPRHRTAFARLTALAMAAAFTVAGLAAAGPAVAADGDVTWGVRTSSNAEGADRQNYNYSVDPGGQVTDGLIISNHDQAPLELDVYAADGFTTTSGQLDVLTRDTPSVAVGSWVTLGSGHVTVPAGESLEVPFTLTVPADATPGDYAGGVLTSLSQAGSGQGITVDRRLGIRIHLRVGGTLAPALSIENLQVDYAGTLNPFGTGEAAVSYTIRNTGNVRLSAAQAVSLAGPFGLLPIDVTSVEPAPELLPGESWQVAVPVTGVFPAFVLSAKAVLTPQLAPELADASGGTPQLTTVEGSASTVDIPWPLLVLLVLVAAIVVAAVLLVRRRRRRAKALEDARVKDAVAKALEERESEPTPAA